MKPANSIVITAILTLGVLEVCAIMNGINGTFRTLIFSAICGLAGLGIKRPQIFGGEK